MATKDTHDKLTRLLRTLFQFDQADLDFGIYRIMNSKREEILRFLDKDLLPQVQAAFAKYSDSGTATTASELAALEARLKADGVEPSQSKKYQELAAKLEEAKKGGLTDSASLEREVFSDLYNFFSRYYDEGDFLSLRRYKAGVYAVPYEGEEVYLHWANKDQYYIKTTEYLRDYTFKLSDGRRVHFKLVEANTETDNRKEQAGQERRFFLDSDEPMAEDIGADGKPELLIRFHYKPVAGEKKKQADLNTKAVAAIFASKTFGEWTTALAKVDPSPSNPQRTLLEKHLGNYTSRNTFDYFIHKDLSGFLCRELDFFIKNEVMHLDDIESDTAPRVEQYLSKVRVMRSIAGKIIDFLAQLEAFQKRLWLKRKFVLATDFYVTLDRVPEKLYSEIAGNSSQLDEWESLFGVSAITESLHGVGYSRPPTKEFLRQNPGLFINSRHFSQAFKDSLLEANADLSESIAGILFHADNAQALRLMQSTMHRRVDCIYIDPPYNAKTTEILYRNSYKHSSWLSFIGDRLSVSRRLMSSRAALVVAIDENEQERLGMLIDTLFPSFDKTCVSVVHNKKGIQGSYFSFNHEYAYFVIPPDLAGTNRLAIEADDQDEANLRKWGSESERSTAKNCFYPIFIKDGEIVGFGDVCKESFHPSAANVVQPDGTIAVYPIDPKRVERKWRYARDSVESIRGLLSVNGDTERGFQIFKSRDSQLVKTVWDDSRYIAGDYGTAVLTNMGFPSGAFSFPKSVHTVADSVHIVSGKQALVLDFFGGSGTTAHAVRSLNVADGGSRRWVMVEMGQYCEDVTRPRVLKCHYSLDWENGLPLDRNSGFSGIIKTLSLESYEDTLNNVLLSRSDQQTGLLEANRDVREDYTLRYMLDVESRESLLKVDQFSDPYAYKLKVHRNGETQEVAVDLVETFNWLLGLTVKSISVVRNVRVVEGTNPEGQKVLVLWRKTVGKDAVDNDALNKWFEKSQYSTKDREFDLIYVNGDNHLENVRSSPEHAEAIWKVRLIEAEFQRLMFEDCE